MAKQVIREGASVYRAHCGECGAVFTYEREDVSHNYVRGGDWVHCPCCGHSVMHLGAEAAAGTRTRFSMSCAR